MIKVEIRILPKLYRQLEADAKKEDLSLPRLIGTRLARVYDMDIADAMPKLKHAGRRRGT